MFSKLRYPKTLVDSTTNKFSQEPDKEIHTVPSVDPSVYIVLPFKDQRSADRVRKDIYSLGAKIDVNVELASLHVYLFQCDLFEPASGVIRIPQHFVVVVFFFVDLNGFCSRKSKG